MEVQLNVEADRLASEYLSDSIPQSKALLFPSAKCQLVIDGNTISRKIPHAIRFHAGAGPLRIYLMQRNNWTEAVLDSIDWQAHGTAHSHHRKHQGFLVKFCHRHLPLGKHLHRRNEKYPSVCPGCREATENHDHFIGCGATARILWRAGLLSTIRRQLETSGTHPNLTEAIVNVLDRAIAGRPISITGPYERSLRAQEKIGWRSMLQGYWSEEWQTIFHSTYHEPAEETPAAKSKRHIQMRRWQSQLIRTIWSSMIALWAIRNDDRHGRDLETREAALNEVLTNEISLLYENQDQYPDAVRTLLRTTFEDHRSDTASQLDDWLHAHRVTFQVTHNRLDG